MKNKLPVMIICDVFVAAVILCTFSYLHHVKRMTRDDGEIIGADTVNTKNDENIHDDAAESDDADDFGEKFADKFADVGVVEKTDEYYRSHDIYLTVTEVFEKLDNDYDAKYIVYDVYVRNLENLFTVTTSVRKPFTELVDAAGDAIAVISGDFCGNTADYTIRNGQIVTKDRTIDSDICLLLADGSMRIITTSEYADGIVDNLDIYQSWDFGPSLLDNNGKAYGDFEAYSDISPRNPRSAIGYYEPGHYVFIVAEGRCDVEYNGESSYYKGIRLPDFARIFEELGVSLAYNLDGGDSAYAYYDGKILRQDYERSTDPSKEPRKIYDIICIGEVSE